MKKKNSSKDDSPNGIRGGDGNIFATDFNGALPLLEIKPGAYQKSDADRNNITIEMKVISREPAWEVDAIEVMGSKVRENNANRGCQNQEKNAMAIFNSSDIEFFTKENTGGKDDKRC